MLPLTYQSTSYSKVVDYNDFYNSKLPEVRRVQRLIDCLKMTFHVPQSKIILEVGETERAYKVTIQQGGAKNIPFGQFVLMPLEYRLDMFDLNDPYSPMAQWVRRKNVYNSFSPFLIEAGVLKLFDKIIAAVQ